jgi:hypothetical protein
MREPGAGRERGAVHAARRPSFAVDNLAFAHPDGAAAFGDGLVGRRFLWNVKA